MLSVTLLEASSLTAMDDNGELKLQQWQPGRQAGRVMNSNGAFPASELTALYHMPSPIMLPTVALPTFCTYNGVLA